MSDTQTKRSLVAEFREELDHLREAAVLQSETSFAAEMTNIPGDIAIALSTDRPMFLSMAKPGAQTATQAAALYEIIHVMMLTNQALRDHIKGVGRLLLPIELLAENAPLRDLSQLHVMLGEAVDFCNFDDEEATENAALRQSPV